jgi:hypothetical protein
MEQMMDNVLFLFIFLLLFMAFVVLELALQRWVFKNSDER